MKLYVYDMYWKGAVVVVANSKEEALQKLSESDTDASEGKLDVNRLEEYEITPDLVVETLGDR